MNIHSVTLDPGVPFVYYRTDGLGDYRNNRNGLVLDVEVLHSILEVIVTRVSILFLFLFFFSRRVILVFIVILVIKLNI